MQIGAAGIPTAVKGLKVRNKGKGKGFTFNMELDIPDVKGVIDAEKIGTVFVAELIDMIRATWERGQVLPYRSRAVTKAMERRRLLWGSLMETMPTDTKSFNKMIKPLKDQFKALVEEEADWAEIYSYMYNLDRLDYLRRHYTFRSQVQRAIKGVQRSKYEFMRFMPNPSRGKAVVDSGLMSFSLHGRFRSKSTYINKDTGEPGVHNAQIIMAVAQSRQTAAKKAGLNSSNDSYFTNMTNANLRAFENTNAMLKEAVYWDGLGQDMVHILTALKILYRVAQFAGRL